MQLHTYDQETEIYETLDALLELKKTGKVLNFGFCNYSRGNQVDNLVNKANVVGINLPVANYYNMIEKELKMN